MKKIGILGNPLSHSLSPIMHNAAIKHLKLNLEFEKWEIDQVNLSGFFSNLDKNQIIGGCVKIFQLIYSNTKLKIQICY